jgi:hypothetical protein
MKRLMYLSLWILALVSLQLSGAERSPLDENLKVLEPFLGSWRGEFKSSTPEKPMVDVSLWERALNGKAVRITHSINEGVYGGETIVTWDAEKKSIVYHYFSTGDFQTKGTMKVAGKKLECHEVVIGNAGGAREVMAVIEMKGDDAMETSTKLLKDGSWEQAHEVSYKRAPEVRPTFK